MKYFFKAFFWLCLAMAGLGACNRYEDDVLPVRKNPRNILNDDNLSAYVNRPFRLQVFANDSIVTDGMLIFGRPQHGKILPDSVGFVYQPLKDFQGLDQFYYKYCVGQDCDSALVSITILPGVPNCTLKANRDVVSFTVSSPVVIAVLANDVTCGPVSVRSISQPRHGKATLLPTNEIQYSPSNGYAGPDSLVYEMEAPDGRRSAATVAITGYLNCFLLAKPDLANTVTNDSVTVFPVHNDITCNDPVTIKLISNPQHGAATLLPNNRIGYQPHFNFNGHDTFTYEICNGNNQCSQSTISVITQAPVNCNTSFTARNDSLVYPVSAAAAGVYMDVLANDIYCYNQVTSVSVVQQPVHGAVMVVTQNNIMKIHYVRSSAGSAPFTDFLRYQICMLVNGQVICKNAAVKINFN